MFFYNEEDDRYEAFYDRLYPTITPETLCIDHEIDEYDHGDIEDLKRKHIEKAWHEQGNWYDDRPECDD